MQLTIPDCCLGEFCPGIHAEGHHKRDDGTYYSADDNEGNAFHYHNTDGSAFYRYPDGSEYYRRKNGNLTFRLPEEPNENAEGADPAAALTPATTDRTRRPWYDWPPQLNLSLKTDGNSVIIRDAYGSTVTFEPAGTNAGVGLVPVYNGDTSTWEAQLDRSGPRASQGVTFGTQAWVKKQALADIVSRGGTGDGVVSI